MAPPPIELPASSIPNPKFEMADIDDTFGALQIGSLFSMFLFGIVTLQCYVYSTRFEDDRRVFKLLVSAVWIFELAHTISIAYEVYTATITHYGKADQYTRYPGFGLATIFGGTITMLVQTFFAFRVYTILPSRWHFVGLFCILLTTARCVVSVYAGIKGILATSIAGYTERFRAMLAALLISGAVIDVVVAVSMLWFLIRRRGDAMESAVRLIDKLVVYTVRTGLVTSLAAVTIVIVFLLQSQNLIWLALYTLLAKLYSNSLLSALNARTGLRQGIGSTPSKLTPIRTRLRAGSSSEPREKQLPKAISIEMQTSTQMRVDEVPARCFTVQFGTQDDLGEGENANRHWSVPDYNPSWSESRSGDEGRADSIGRDRDSDATLGSQAVVGLAKPCGSPASGSSCLSSSTRTTYDAV